MQYVIRDESGVVTGLGLAYRVDGTPLFDPDPLPDDHPDVLDFHERQANPFPHTITFRQLVIRAAIDQWITPEDALAWSRRAEIPAIMAAVIATLTPEQQVVANVTAATMVEAQRSDPLLAAIAGEAIAVAIGSAPSESDLDDALDAFFRAAAQL